MVTSVRPMRWEMVAFGLTRGSSRLCPKSGVTQNVARTAAATPCFVVLNMRGSFPNDEGSYQFEDGGIYSGRPQQRNVFEKRRIYGQDNRHFPRDCFPARWLRRICRSRSHGG